MKHTNPKRGKASARLNFFTMAATVAGLSVYFTVQGLWSAPLVIVMVLLTIMCGFYFWLWRTWFK
jgi:Flp pilus assembly protein TadB